ncbi:tetratricopeptide repeat protein [Marinobacter sp. SS21]|uniref:tetratricopeptide repeat protein n=1 Tax=Marinobacter sp. SS21 TaxID=2979460 RepID=UPI00232D043C|nr:tetratricopeptide repeat protein [Marinobacter sp. SS21]MDC0662419.1 tetratricopeptide repeat protein [Marinobacter sp. SS21]
MAMVSVKPRRTVGLMAVLLVSGCASLQQFAPGSASAPSGSDATVVTAEQPVIGASTSKPMTLAESGAPLPKQVYDSVGQKIAYASEPNPYTVDQAPVPPQAVADFRTASALLDAEKYRDARIAFRQMTRDFPELSGPWVKLGDIAEARGYQDKAEEAYRQALEVNPNNVNAYLSLALHLRRKGEFVGAQQVYIDALTLWKDFPGAHLNLAILYDLYLNRPELAQPHYEAYDFLTDGSHPQVANWLIEVRRRTGIETRFVDAPPPVQEPAPAETPVASEQNADVEPSDKG